MKDTILVVEDSKLNSKYIRTVLESVGYNVCQAYNGIQAIEKLENQLPSIKAITLDRNMPKMDGFEFRKKMMNDDRFTGIPVIFITDLSNKHNILEGLELEVYDYLSKPIDKDLLIVKIKNAIKLYNTELKLKNANKKLELRNKNLQKIVEHRTEKLKNLTNSILNLLEEASSYNDKDTGNHIERVAEFSGLLAEKYGLSKKFIKDIKLYSPLHDIGKLGIPHAILKKKGKLTATEFDIMKNHVIIGKDLLAKTNLPAIAENIILYHHEKWNGKGYPTGLKGEEIPIEARIVSIADVFDALTSPRSYKEAYSIEKASLIMSKDMYESFDPNLLKTFFNSMKEIREIRAKINKYNLLNI